MLLPFHDGLYETWRTDPECAALADRHYSRQSHAHREFIAPGQTMVLRSWRGDVLFCWRKAQLRSDNQLGINCTLFRNESTRRSSEIILEAEQFVLARWGHVRVFTYINPRRIRSTNPGCCFKKAGWQVCGISKKRKRILMEKFL